MPTRLRMLCIAACIALAACSNDVKQTTSGALDTAGAETGASYNKLREYLGVGHQAKPAEARNGEQARYCYHTYQDIICYAQPLPGEEYRLVAYQSAAGKTGYTLPPPPAGMTLPPLPPPPSSVAVASPPAVKGDSDDKKQLKEIIFDPSELQPKELVPDKMQ